jgi:hypothetical protein
LVGVAGVSSGYRADTCLWRVVLRSGGSISRIQGFEARIEAFGFACIRRFYSRFNHNSDYNYFIINILILTIMVEHLLFANETYDTAKQAVAKNQIIQMNGYEYDQYVVYDITEGNGKLIYKLINLRTRKFGQCDLIRPLSEKFGIGYYYDDENRQFMDAFEVLAFYSEAEYKRGKNRKQSKGNRKGTDN